jgi:hypothetical protein
MRIKTICVTYGRKINLGDYNSCEIGLSLWADLDGDDPGDAIRALQAQARTQAKAEYVRIAAQVKTPVNGKLHG